MEAFIVLLWNVVSRVLRSYVLVVTRHINVLNNKGYPLSPDLFLLL